MFVKIQWVSFVVKENLFYTENICGFNYKIMIRLKWDPTALNVRHKKNVII